MVPELVDAHQLLGRSMSEPDLLELVQLVRFPVDGRTKVTFKDCPNPRIALCIIMSLKHMLILSPCSLLDKMRARGQTHL